MPGLHREHAILPYPLPEDAMQRLALAALRRMGAHGIRDACAALLFIEAFGLHFRKPLVLARAFMVELARASCSTIRLAPCCALRMTEDEARMVGVLATAASNPSCAARHLAQLAGTEEVAAPLSAAAAFNDTLASLGQPLAI